MIRKHFQVRESSKKNSFYFIVNIIIKWDLIPSFNVFISRFVFFHWTTLKHFGFQAFNRFGRSEKEKKTFLMTGLKNWGSQTKHWDTNQKQITDQFEKTTNVLFNDFSIVKILAFDPVR